MAEGTRSGKVEEMKGLGELEAELSLARAEIQKAKSTVIAKMSIKSEKMSRMDQEHRASIAELKATVVQQTSLLSMLLKGKAKDEGSGSVVPMQMPVETEDTMGLFSGRNMKVEVPHFDGTEVESWLFKIKEFFILCSTLENQRMRIASIHMEGAAWDWYQRLIENEVVHTLKEFTEALLDQFGRSIYDDPKCKLKRVVQTGNVDEYQAEFLKVSTKIKGLDESFIVSFFIEGLQEHLQCDVLQAQPALFPQAVAIAKLQERKHAKLQAAF